jgi:hypothetical protein
MQCYCRRLLRDSVICKSTRLWAALVTNNGSNPSRGKIGHSPPPGAELNVKSAPPICLHGPTLRFLASTLEAA